MTTSLMALVTSAKQRSSRTVSVCLSEFEVIVTRRALRRVRLWGDAADCKLRDLNNHSEMTQTKVVEELTWTQKQ